MAIQNIIIISLQGWASPNIAAGEASLLAIIKVSYL